MTLRTTSACGMPEYHNDALVPPKHGVLSPFAIFVWCGLIAIVLGVGALFVIKFDLERLRGTGYFMEKARQAIVRKDWAVAASAMQHIQGPDREEPGYLRVVADYLEATRSDPSMLHTTLDKLEAKGKMLPMDYLWACRLQLAANKIDVARRALEKVPTAQRNSADALKLSVAILNEEGRPKEAADEEARLFRLFPDDPEVSLHMAARDLESPFPEIQQGALKRLWGLAEQPIEAGLNAIRVLSRQNSLSRAEATHLLELVEKYPVIAPAERLRVVSVVMRLDPDRRTRMIQAEINRYQTSHPAAQADLISWLVQEKEYARVMEFMPEEKLIRSPDLFPVVAQGLAEQKKWTDLLSLLGKDKKLPVSNARAANWRALATHNLHQDDSRQTRMHLEEAIREGLLEKNAHAVLATAKLAEEWSLPDLALSAYQSLAEPGLPQESSMLGKCLEMAALLKDSSSLLKFSDRLAKLKPGNIELLHQRDYLRLLMGQDIEMAVKNTTASEPDKPEEDIALLLKALQAYRLNDRTLAAKTVREIHVPAKLTSGERAIYAGMLAMSGDLSQAFAIAESIHPELLLKEELVFLQMAL